MNAFFSKKTVGFYLSIIAAVLALIGMVLYQGMKQEATLLVIAAVVVEVILIVGSGFSGGHRIFDFFPSASALLLTAGIMISLPSQIDGFGYLVSGLYTFDDMRGAILFLGFSLGALLLYLISSFMDMSKR